MSPKFSQPGYHRGGSKSSQNASHLATAAAKSHAMTGSSHTAGASALGTNPAKMNAAQASTASTSKTISSPTIARIDSSNPLTATTAALGTRAATGLNPTSGAGMGRLGVGAVAAKTASLAPTTTNATPTTSTSPTTTSTSSIATTTPAQSTAASSGLLPYSHAGAFLNGYGGYGSNGSGYNHYGYRRSNSYGNGYGRGYYGNNNSNHFATMQRLNRLINDLNQLRPGVSPNPGMAYRLRTDLMGVSHGYNRPPSQMVYQLATHLTSVLPSRTTPYINTAHLARDMMTVLNSGNGAAINAMHSAHNAASILRSAGVPAQGAQMIMSDLVAIGSWHNGGNGMAMGAGMNGFGGFP
jgi:hypothetical protein